ncbi:ABC-2 family transporter protein [Planctomycetes bacterium Pan216]|uniref:ABC-2 family transporter protein n=1 Tax=Kolteria novifilia TaxID=2527975 RepID=A0A518AYL8_9BACT|nr:ABC-2 family transporter protein [Planctomycetes bacterium Pan216]
MRRWTLFGPILGWEMTTLIRRRRYFFVRALYACVLLVVLYTSYEQARLAWGGGPTGSDPSLEFFSRFAQQFFSQFSFAQLFAILLLTPAYVGTAITVERERRTIEYLFATDLRNREVVLGKWAARSLNVGLLVLVGIPILSFAQLFGGIDATKLLWFSILSLATIASTSAVAMLVSIYITRLRRAITAVYAWVVILLLSPLLLSLGSYSIAETIEWWYDHKTPASRFFGALAEFIAEQLSIIEPFVAWYWLIESTSLDQVAFIVTLYSAFHLSLAVVLLSFAVTRIRAIHRGASGGKKKGWTLPWRRERKRILTVKHDPMLWKEWTFEIRAHRSFVATGALLALLLGFYAPFAAGFYEHFYHGKHLRAAFTDLDDYLKFVGTLIIGLTYIWVAIRAASSVTAERERDTWLSILSTPLTGREIVRAKMLHSLRPIIVVLGILLPGWCVAVYVGSLSFFAVPCLVIATLAYALFVAALGVHHSLLRKSTMSSIGVTFVILALFGGFGHLFGSFLIFLPLVATGIDAELITKLVILALPWAVLAGSAFTSEEFEQDYLAGDSDLLLISVGYVLLFAAIGVVLYARAILQFDHWMGRGEEHPPPGPMHRTKLPGIGGSSSPVSTGSTDAAQVGAVNKRPTERLDEPSG